MTLNHINQVNIDERSTMNLHELVRVERFEQ